LRVFVLIVYASTKLAALRESGHYNAAGQF
jgi:hypothetical protein